MWTVPEPWPPHSEHWLQHTAAQRLTEGCWEQPPAGPCAPQGPARTSHCCMTFWTKKTFKTCNECTQIHLTAVSIHDTAACCKAVRAVKSNLSNQSYEMWFSSAWTADCRAYIDSSTMLFACCPGRRVVHEGSGGWGRGGGKKKSYNLFAVKGFSFVSKRCGNRCLYAAQEPFSFPEKKHRKKCNLYSRTARFRRVEHELEIQQVVFQWQPVLRCTKNKSPSATKQGWTGPACSRVCVYLQASKSVCVYLQACIHLSCFAPQLSSASEQLSSFGVQGWCQRARVSEGFLTQAGQALIWGMEVRQCVHLSHFILQIKLSSEFS